MRGVVVFLVLSLFLVGNLNALRTRAVGDAPTLNMIEVMDVDVQSPKNATATFGVSNLSGVKYVHIVFGDADHLVGEAMWNNTSTDTDVDETVPVMIYDTTPGIYPMNITVCDSNNACETFYDTDLEALDMQSEVVVYSLMVTITCPSQQTSVLTGVAEVDCVMTIVSDPIPITSYVVTGVLYDNDGNALKTEYPDNGNFDEPDATNQSISVYTIFHLLQYAANGTYIVTAEASGPNNVYHTAMSQFVVKAEINDLYPPVLGAVMAPDVKLPASVNTISVQVQVTDDGVGIKNVTVEIPGLGMGNWTNSITEIGTNKSSTITVHITTLYSTLVKRLYYLDVTVCDRTDKCQDYSTQNLIDAGLQSTYNVGPVNANGDAGTLSCGGPFDVAKGPITVVCTYTVTFVTGIYTYTVFAARNTDDDDPDSPTLSMQAVPGYYMDMTGNNITQTSTQKIILPQYAPYGTYTVTATAYNEDLSASYVTTATFEVSHTTNDMGPPTLKTLSVPPPPDINSFRAKVSASDDASGVASIQVFMFSEGVTGTGIANTTATKNNKVVTNVDIPIKMNLYNTSTSVFFVVEVMLQDVLGNKKYYSTLELGQMGFQANITLLPVSTTGAVVTTGGATTGKSTGGTTSGTHSTTTDGGVAVRVSFGTTILAFVFLGLLNYMMA